MELYTTREAATFLRLGKPTLERYRLTGKGPRYFKLGATVRYRREELEAWLEGHLTRSTSEAA